MQTHLAVKTSKVWAGREKENINQDKEKLLTISRFMPPIVWYPAIGRTASSW